MKCFRIIRCSSAAILVRRLMLPEHCTSRFQKIITCNYILLAPPKKDVCVSLAGAKRYYLLMQYITGTHYQGVAQRSAAQLRPGKFG